jgi:hypothetical protein
VKLAAIGIVVVVLLTGCASHHTESAKVCRDAGAVFDQWAFRPQTAGDAREADDVATLRIEAVNATKAIQAAVSDLRNAVIQADPTLIAKYQGEVLGACRAAGV